MQIYVELNLKESDKQLIRGLADATFWFARPSQTTEADHAAFRASEVVFGNCTPAWLNDAPELRWIQFASVGVDTYQSLDWATLGQRVRSTNLNGVFAEPVAESCLAGILTLYRGIDRLLPLQASGDWQKLAVRPQLRLLHGARVLILGAGSIAQRLRALLEPFGCRVMLFGRTSGDIHTIEELDREVAEADIVAGLLPDNPQSRNLFDAARLGRMKPGALFVNAGRGSLVDEAALVEALVSGRLGGAVLDVTVQEPLPSDHPLWRAPNIILTQHTGGGSTDEYRRVIDVFVDNIARYQQGLPLVNVVHW